MANDTTTIPDLLTLAVQGVDSAVTNTLRYANDEGLRNIFRAAEAGTLAIEIGVDPDGDVWGRYVDDARLRCWDDCDGILTFHRAGWCPFNPEHADFDCGCGIDYVEEDTVDDEIPDLWDGLGDVVDPDEETYQRDLLDPDFDEDDGFVEPDEDGDPDGWMVGQDRYEGWLNSLG